MCTIAPFYLYTVQTERNLVCLTSVNVVFTGLAIKRERISVLSELF